MGRFIYYELPRCRRHFGISSSPRARMISTLDADKIRHATATTIIVAAPDLLPFLHDSHYEVKNRPPSFDFRGDEVGQVRRLL